MNTKDFIIKSWGELKYNAPVNNYQVEGILRRDAIFESKEATPFGQDEIIVTLWDHLALKKLAVGDVVTATLLFGIYHKSDGTACQAAEVMEIE
jgi:hypothetical protein